jgi:hypothetical protein
MPPESVSPEGRAKNVGTFMRIMEHQPLSLALVVMNFVLLGYLFYAGQSSHSQTRENTAAIVKWQEATDKLMASCVSGDIMKMVLDAIRQPYTPPPPATEQK